MNNKLFYDEHLIECKTFYLDTNIKEDDYNKWFKKDHITVLDKGECGNGGTTGIINYSLKNNKGVLLIVPNVSICKSKEEQYKDDDRVQCVYGGVTNINKNAVVIIATYDQFEKMNDTVYGCGMNIIDGCFESWTGRTVVVDEFHKLVDECGFRDVCFNVSKMIKKHRNGGVILMSATPHWAYVEFLKNYLKNDVSVYSVKYDECEDERFSDITKIVMLYDVRKKYADIIKKIYTATQRKEHIVVFFNNREGIKKILQKMDVTDCEVLCSKEKKDEFAEFYSEIPNENKHIHFLTSAYFTGCDINFMIDRCVIIGSKSRSFMRYTDRDIKQMVGRCRCGVKQSGVHLFYDGKSQDEYDYNECNAEFIKCSDLLSKMSEDWDNEEFVYLKQKELMLKDRLLYSKNWESIDNVSKMLSDFGFSVRMGKVAKFEEIEKVKKLSFKETKERIIKGENVDWLENNNVVAIKKYFEVFGEMKTRGAKFQEIIQWYKINSNVDTSKTVDMTTLLPNELFDYMGLKEGFYTGSYLMSVLKYIGVECDYAMLSEKMGEYFGVWCVNISSVTERKDKDKWMVIQKSVFFDIFEEESLYSNNSSKMSKKTEISPIISYQTSIKDTKTYGKTFILDTCVFNSLSKIPLYDYVNKDKKNLLPQYKKTTEWEGIKKFEQNKISEMFKMSKNNKEYRFIIGEMSNINSLIIDIDEGVSFSQFKEMYKGYKWTAYPTINNVTEDWTKYRVIVPLDEVLNISGENNLKVVKLLRKMFCPFEDAQHMMFSFINNEDWEKRYENDGQTYHISQELVDELVIRINLFKEYKDKKYTENVKTTTTYTDEQSKTRVEKFIDMINNAQDGEWNNKFWAAVYYMDWSEVDEVKSGIIGEERLMYFEEKMRYKPKKQYFNSI